MSKKIIAIALFATMLLSLVTVANAASDPAPITGIEAKLVNAKDTKNDSAQITDQTVTKNGSTITLKAKYADLVKTANEWNTAEDAKYTLTFTLTNAGLSDGNWFKVDGSTKKPTNDKISVDFYAAKGGNSKDFILTYNQMLPNETIVEASFKVTVTFIDDGSSSKPEKSMSFDPYGDPIVAGNYNVYTLGGVMFIDYDSNLPKPAVNPAGGYFDRMGFRFYSDGNRIPASGKYAYVHGDTTDTENTGGIKAKEFIYVAGNTSSASYPTPGDGFATGDVPNFFLSDVVGDQVKNDTTFGAYFYIDPRISSMKIVLEDENYIYNSGSVSIVWRAVPRNEITNTNITVDTRKYDLVVGESKTLDISATHATTYNKIRLVDTSYNAVVLCEDLKVTALRAGNTVLQVQISTDGGVNWKGIDSIEVNVTEPSVAQPTPTAPTTSQYRVLASGNLNVRSGPGTSYPIVGKVTQATVLTVEEISNGWAKLANNGGYVSAQFIAAIGNTTTIGNYQVTASNLNVRSTPNGSIVGKLSKGSVVSVVAFSGNWAQLSTGSYVSTAYLKAI